MRDDVTQKAIWTPLDEPWTHTRVFSNGDLRRLLNIDSVAMLPGFFVDDLDVSGETTRQQCAGKVTSCID